MTVTSFLVRASDFLWVRMPDVAIRASTLLGVGLADGGYLRAWPKVASIAPAGALLLGFVLGAGHPEELYTYSLLVMAVLGIASGLGAGLGLWAITGFVVGDFFLSRRGPTSRLAITPDLDGVKAAAALVLTYLLLAGLLVLIPVVARTIRAVVLGRFPALPTVGSVALVLVYVVLAFLWTQSTPFLIRPVWSYFSNMPDVPAIEPLQQRGWVVVIAIIAAVGLRLRLEHLASRILDPHELPRFDVGSRPLMQWWLRVSVRTAFVAFMISGFFANGLELIVSSAVLFGIFFLQIRFLPGVTGYADFLSRIPILVRIGVAVALSYIAGLAIVERAVDTGTQSFQPLIVATLLSLLVVAALVPDRAARTSVAGPRAGQK